LHDKNEIIAFHPKTLNKKTYLMKFHFKIENQNYNLFQKIYKASSSSLLCFKNIKIMNFKLFCLKLVQKICCFVIFFKNFSMKKSIMQTYANLKVSSKNFLKNLPSFILDPLRLETSKKILTV
jgi:hypothetical protein